MFALGLVENSLVTQVWTRGPPPLRRKAGLGVHQNHHGRRVTPGHTISGGPAVVLDHVRHVMYILDSRVRLAAVRPWASTTVLVTVVGSLYLVC